MLKPYYNAGGITIYHGDCLDVIGALSPGIDAVVTDPPYASGARTEAKKSSSGAMLRGARFAGHPITNDQMTTTGFVWLLRAVALGVYPLLVEGGSFLSFIDWRQWPNLVGALETCNYRVQGMVVWDKGSMGLGNGFRAQHELVCHAAKGVPVIHHKGASNVITCRRDKPTNHPSPKPLALMKQLITVVAPPSGLVFDPFAGCGATLVAAQAMKCLAVGVETSERYCEIAARRLEQQSLAAV